MSWCFLYISTPQFEQNHYFAKQLITAGLNQGMLKVSSLFFSTQLHLFLITWGKIFKVHRKQRSDAPEGNAYDTSHQNFWSSVELYISSVFWIPMILLRSISTVIDDLNQAFKQKKIKTTEKRSIKHKINTKPLPNFHVLGQSCNIWHQKGQRQTSKKSDRWNRRWYFQLNAILLKSSTTL